MDDFKTKVTIGDSIWRFSQASVAEFNRRASDYRPSRVARDYFATMKADGASLADGRSIDLLNWIKRTMALPDAEKLRGQFARVLLTGGSSEWPFMKKLAAGIFGVGEDRIIRSAAPEMTIGSGLAIYNVLSRRYQTAINKLRHETPGRRTQYEGDIQGRIGDFSRAVARRHDRPAHGKGGEALPQLAAPREDRSSQSKLTSIAIAKTRSPGPLRLSRRIPNVLRTTCCRP